MRRTGFMASILKKAALDFLRFTVRVYKGLDRNYCFDMSAELGFYFLYSLFPFFIFLMAILGYLPIPVTPEEVLSTLKMFLPGYLFTLAGQSIMDIIFRPRHWLALGTLMLTLWPVSLAVSSLMTSLNRIYGVKETRPFWMRKSICLLLIAAFVGVLLTAFVLLVLGPATKDWLISRIGLSRIFTVLFDSSRWFIAVAAMFFTIEIIFSLGPCIKKRFTIVSWGSFVTLAGWFVLSEAFGIYFQNAPSYNLFYGTAGGIVGLMTWLYLMGLMILVGAQVNYELEK